MEGICGNCNGNPDDDLLTNPAKTNLPSNYSPTEKFAMSWLAEEPKLGLNETDPCLKIFEDELFGQCHFVVEPMMYITACQQDLARTGPSQKGSCESVAAYARECARNGVCIDWRKNGFCTMDW
jgi:von Willebrand factor